MKGTSPGGIEQPAATHRRIVRRRRFGRLRAFVVKERSARVMIALLIVPALAGVVLRLYFFHDWLVGSAAHSL